MRNTQGFPPEPISPARWFVYVIHSPFFLQSAHFVPSKTFSRNKTHLKTHLVQLKTFIWNEIVLAFSRQLFKTVHLVVYLDAVGLTAGMGGQTY